jgi:hypothetical protein
MEWFGVFMGGVWVGSIVGFLVACGALHWVRKMGERWTPKDRPPLVGGVRRSIDPKTGLETGETPRHLRDDPLGTKIGAPLD